MDSVSLSSDCVNEQADLALHCSHMPEGHLCVAPLFYFVVSHYDHLMVTSKLKFICPTPVIAPPSPASGAYIIGEVGDCGPIEGDADNTLRFVHALYSIEAYN